MQPITNLKYPSNISSEIKTKNDLKLGQVFSAEVIDIILDSTHPLYKSDKDIGLIQFYSFQGPTGFANPLNFYIQKVPLKHEIVLIINSTNTNSNEFSGKTSYYYIDTVSVWNILNFNPSPFSAIKQPIDEIKSTTYSNFSGNSKKQAEPNFGEYFESKANIPTLIPFEGDILIQGRWGNTIRLGSSIKEKTPWSKNDETGNPILVLSVNGTESEKSRIEDINKDSSSIYICEKQKLDIKAVSDLKSSYNKTKNKPEDASKFLGNQIALNSDRLFFQSKTDSIFLNSKKTIHLSSQESINIDTKNDIAVFSEKSISVNSKNIVISSDSLFLQGKIKGIPKFEIGATGIFTSFEGRLITVTNGLITDIS